MKLESLITFFASNPSVRLLRSLHAPFTTAEYSDDERAVGFRELAETQKLDWDALRLNIASALNGNVRTTLPDLLRGFPTISTIELLGYIQLAHDDGHEVDEKNNETVFVSDADGNAESRPFDVPSVVFLSERLRLPEPI